MTALDLNPFFSQGFQHLPGIISVAVLAEIRQFLLGALDKVLRDLQTELPALQQLAEIPALMAQLEADPARFENLSPATRSLLVGHFSLETRLSPVLWGIPRSAALQHLLTQVFTGQSYAMHMPPTARYVLPGNRWAAVPVHQDISYNRHMEQFVTVWVPLVPITPDCGGVVFFPNTGHLPEQPQKSAQGLFWQGGVAVPEEPPIMPELVPGDILLINPWVLHASAPNHSVHTRLSIDYRFFTGRSLKHSLDLSCWQVREPGA